MSQPRNGARPAPAQIEGYYLQSELWELSRYETNADQRLRARIISALIEPEFRSVLDVGCGNGFITRHIQAERVVGLDPSPEALSHFKGECILGTADQLPFGDGAFDVVVCTEVLEHLSKDVYCDAVRELARVARRSIVIGVPYDQDLRIGMTRCADCGHEFHTDLHQRRFHSAKQLAEDFPGTTIGATVLLGQSRRLRYSWFRVLRYWLEGPWAPPSMALCPRCGCNKMTHRRTIARWLTRPIFDRLRWRLPQNVLPLWMIVELRKS